MAKNRAGHEMRVKYGAAGSTAGTHINVNVTDVDPGIGGWEFSDNPQRGDGTKVPAEDNMPVKRTYGPPKFSMIYKDGETHVTALLAAADANPPVGKAIVFERYSGGAAVFDKDCYLTYTSPGPIADGQIIEFECKPTSAYGRETE
jgi:hypothetical protein